MFVVWCGLFLIGYTHTRHMGLPVRTADQARDGARGVNVGIECLGMCESPSVPFSGDPVEKDAGELESLRTEGCKSGCSKEVGAELKFLC